MECVDAGSTVGTNWLRYVNCARHEGERNLMAFQYKGEVYYRTVKKVAPFTELLVQCRHEFAARLGINFARPTPQQTKSKIE